MRLLVVAAFLVGCFAASLSGTLAAFAHAQPPMDSKPKAPQRKVVTLGMMLAEHPPV